MTISDPWSRYAAFKIFTVLEIDQCNDELGKFYFNFKAAAISEHVRTCKLQDHMDCTVRLNSRLVVNDL